MAPHPHPMARSSRRGGVEHHARTVVYAIGGTGAKLCEALIYLSAAGLTTKNWTLRLIDQDHSNGNAQRAARAFLSYRKVREKLGAPLGEPAGGLFRSEIGGDGEILPVLPRSNSTLVSAYGVAARPDFERHLPAVLMHALFSAEERDDEMSNGFRARPAVGCAAFLSAEARRHAPAWRAINRDLADAAHEQVDQFLLLGSIFGGTGAAGVPTLARHLRTNAGGVRRPRMGAVLGLRYFSVAQPQNASTYGPVNIARMRAALTYYEHVLGETAEFRSLDDLYLFGLDPELIVPYEPEGGGEHQANPPLVAELVGAMGAVDFMGRPPPGIGGDATVWIAGRRERDAIGWDDIPACSAYGSAGPLQDRRDLLLDFARFAYAYCYAFHGTDKLSKTKDLKDFVSLWRFLGLAQLRRGDYDDVGQDLAAFCRGFLSWLGGLQVRRGASLSIDLGGLDERLQVSEEGGVAPHLDLQPNPQRLEDCDLGQLAAVKRGFERLRIRGTPPGLARIVQRMATVRRTERLHFESFVRALFECSQASASPAGHAGD